MSHLRFKLPEVIFEKMKDKLLEEVGDYKFERIKGNKRDLCNSIADFADKFYFEHKKKIQKKGAKVTISEGSLSRAFFDYGRNKYDGAVLPLADWICRYLTGDLKITFLEYENLSSQTELTRYLAPFYEEAVIREGEDVYEQEYPEKKKKVEIVVEKTADLPKYLSEIPSLPSTFIGRTKGIQEIHELLKRQQRLLIGGIGGIGKTSITRMYCSTYENDYNHFVWINQSDSFENAWISANRLHQNLDITITGNPKQTIRLIFNALNNIRGRNLLILDNVDQGLKDYTELLPPSWKVLVTSRQKIDERYTKYHLKVLNFKEVKKLFQHHLKKTSFVDSELLSLCKEVGYHTLTLELLAKILQESFELQNIGKLIEYLQKNRLDAEIFKEEVFTQHSKEDVEIYAHLLQAFNLALLEEKEQWLLLQFAVLPPIGHEAKDFLKWIQVEDNKDFSKILKQLYRKGWLERKNNSFSMHRMIQTLIRYQVKPTYEKCRGLVDTFVGLLQVHDMKDNPIETFQWIEYGVSLCEAIREKKKCIGDLNNWTAHCFKNLGSYTQAVQYFQRAIEIAEILKNQRDINTYNKNLATVYLYLGKYNKAAELLEVVLVLHRKDFGEMHPNVAANQSNLAIVYLNLGKYNEAMELAETALTSDRKNFGEEHPNVAIHQSNLANVYLNLGRYNEAMELLEAALTSDRKNFEESHPNVIIRQSNLANVYLNLGKYSEAANLLEIVLAMEIKNFGEGHPNVAGGQTNLASVYESLGRYSEAAELLEAALTSDRKNFAESHPNVARNQANLAIVYSNLGRYSEAVELAEVALISNRKNFAESHPNVATIQTNLANIYRNLGRYNEAVELAKTALASNRKNFGESHPDVARDQSNLANVYSNLGRYSEAMELLEAALVSDRKNFGETHPTVATRQADLADVYFQTKKYNNAKTLFDEAFVIFFRVFGTDHPHTKKMYEKSQKVGITMKLEEEMSYNDYIKIKTQP